MKNYSDSTKVPKVSNKTTFATVNTQSTVKIRNEDSKTVEWTKVNPTITTNQVTDIPNKSNKTFLKDDTSKIIVMTTISSTVKVNTEIVERTNETNPTIYSDTINESTSVKDASNDLFTTQASSTVNIINKNEKTTVNTNFDIKISTKTNNSDSKFDIPREKYSGNFIFLVVVLLVVCLCCCYFFVWRYSKLPLFPFKQNTDHNFTKGVLSEKPETESSYDEIKV